MDGTAEMSSMIRCDKCHVLMYTDARSDKGDYCRISVNYVDGLTALHLCKVCHRQFMTEFLRIYTQEEYDEEFWER